MKVSSLAAVALLALTGCRQQMAEQPRYKPFSESRFFPDGQSARPFVPGTVARGRLRLDPDLYEGGSLRSTPGLAGGALINVGLDVAPLFRPTEVFPFEVTDDLMLRGRERYNIFCAVCHDRVGTGFGKVVQRGYVQPPSYHGERLRAAPVGHFYRVISLGHGAMPSFADQLTPRDRWAIVAYMRALQKSQSATLADVVDPAERMRLEKERGQ